MSIDVAARLLEKGDRLSHRHIWLWVVSSRFLVEARDFYAALAQEARGPVAVLEVCGEPFSSWLAGTGVSAIQLRRASGSCPGPEEDPSGGWADFTLAEPAELIIAPLGVLELVWSAQTRGKVLACVSRNLREGGRFVFDARCWSGIGNVFFDGAPRLVAEEVSPEGVTTMLWETWRRAGAGPGVLELTLGVEYLGRFGTVEKKFYSNLLVGELAPEAVAVAARRAGLTVEGGFGDYYGGGLTLESNMQLWVLAKDGGVYLR